MKLCTILSLLLSVAFLGLVAGNSRRSENNRQSNTGKGDSSDAPFWAARGKREKNELSGVIKYEFIKTPSLGALHALADSGNSDEEVPNWSSSTNANANSNFNPSLFDTQLLQLNSAAEKAMPWSYRMKRTSFLPEYPQNIMREGSQEALSDPTWLMKTAKEYPIPTNKLYSRRNLTLGEYFSVLLGLASADRDRDREKKNGDKDGSKQNGEVPFWAARG